MTTPGWSKPSPLACAAVARRSGRGACQPAGEPIRLGFLSVRSGALGGRRQADGRRHQAVPQGAQLHARRPQGRAHRGRHRRHAGAGRTKTQELVEKNQVQVIIGPLATFEALAIDDYIAQVKVPLITPTSAAQKDLAQQKQSDYVIHAVGTAAQPMHVLGDYRGQEARDQARRRDRRRLHLRPRGRRRVSGGVRGQRRARRAEAMAAAQRRRLRLLHRPDQRRRRRGLRRLRRHQRTAVPEAIRRVRPARRPCSAIRPPSTKASPQHGRRSARRVLGELVFGRTRHARTTSASSTPSRRNTRPCPGFYTAGTYVAGMQLEAALTRSRARIEDKPAFVRALHEVRPREQPDRADLHRRVRQAGAQHLRAQGRAQGREAWSMRSSRPIRRRPSSGPSISKFLAAPVYSRDYRRSRTDVPRRRRAAHGRRIAVRRHRALPTALSRRRQGSDRGAHSRPCWRSQRRGVPRSS